MSEEIGKHKGAVETLLHEKKELSRLLQIVNSQLERHLNALDEAGIDTDQFIQQIQQEGQQQGRQGNQKKQQGSRKSRSGSEKKTRSNNQQKRNSRGRSQRSKDTGEKDSSDEDQDRDFSPL